MLDYRYLYVFKVKKTSLYKIGISKDWKVRKSQVQKSKNMRKKLRLVIAVPLLGATFFEQQLHKKFAAYRKPLKGVSGGTEFFNLGAYDGMVGLRGEVIKYFLIQLLIFTAIVMTAMINFLGWNWREYLEIMLS